MSVSNSAHICIQYF